MTDAAKDAVHSKLSQRVLELGVSAKRGGTHNEAILKALVRPVEVNKLLVEVLPARMGRRKNDRPLRRVFSFFEVVLMNFLVQYGVVHAGRSQTETFGPLSKARNDCWVDEEYTPELNPEATQQGSRYQPRDGLKLSPKTKCQWLTA